MTPRKLNNSYLNVVENVWTTFKENHPWNTYASILALSAYERIGKFENNQTILNESVAIARDFINGKYTKFGGAYGRYIYHLGGSATAWLFARGFMPEAKEKLIAGAEMLINEFPLSTDGAYKFPNKEQELVWIDSLFAICPFLVWLGESVGRKDFTDAAIDQLLIHHKILFNTGLSPAWDEPALLRWLDSGDNRLYCDTIGALGGEHLLSRPDVRCMRVSTGRTSQAFVRLSEKVLANIKAQIF